MSLGDHSVDAMQWLALVELFAEGGDFLPDLDGVNAERCTSQATEIADARHFISTVDSALGRGMDVLQAIVILSEPGPLAKDVGKSFGSASSFFFRGGSIVNAAIKRSFCDWIITLIHEYAHSELFLISQNELMCTNPDHERYSIQIRPDPRPMNGILHSFYVVGRVITFLQSAIQNAMPGRSDRDNFVQEMAARCLSLKQLMQSSHRAIRTHGRLTPLGEEVVQLSCGSIGLGPQPVG
jgi:HEXXH motif-containing protein